MPMWPMKRCTGVADAGLGRPCARAAARPVDVALRRDRESKPNVGDQPVERALEVADDLARVVAGRAARDAVALDQQHAAIGVAQQEERGRDARDAGADDRDVGVEHPRRAAPRRSRGDSCSIHGDRFGRIGAR